MMPKVQLVRLAILLSACLRGIPSSAQVVTDLSDPAFGYDLATRRVEILVTARGAMAQRLLSVAESVVSAPPGARTRVTLLAEAQALADSLERYDAELREAAGDQERERRGLIAILEAEAKAAVAAASAAGITASERATREARARQIEDRIAGLLAERTAPGDAGPLSGHGPALARLSRVAEEERVRLGRLGALQEELRVFVGYLRLFDEGGMPPSARTEGGGSGDPGCPVTSCAAGTLGAPGELGLENVPSAGGTPGEEPSTGTVTPASLDRLRRQLALRTGIADVGGADAPRPMGVVTREVGVALGFVTFQRRGDRSAGTTLRAGGGFQHLRNLGARTQILIEPWVGARSVNLKPGASQEVMAEVRETVSGGLGRGMGWQVTSWQKGRTRTEALPVPAYLEPTRLEGGVVARLAVPVQRSWVFEMGAGADGVTFGSDAWKPLDRSGMSAVIAAIRTSARRSTRITLTAARHGYPNEVGVDRSDTRMGIVADWSSETTRVVRLSVGLTRNDSRLPAYDHRAGRAAVALSLPWGHGSLQGFAALAVQRYDNPGPVARRVAPSDQDTGSLVALQLTRPLGSARSLALRAEWARSVTGFGNDPYHRFGAGLHLAFRALSER